MFSAGRGLGALSFLKRLFNELVVEVDFIEAVSDMDFSDIEGMMLYVCQHYDRLRRYRSAYCVVWGTLLWPIHSNRRHVLILVRISRSSDHCSNLNGSISESDEQTESPGPAPIFIHLSLTAP